MKFAYRAAMFAAASALFASHLQGQNVVTDWAAITQGAIAVPAKAPAYQFVLIATVQIAVYDAAAAIDGGYRPFTANLNLAPNAEMRAAVATAAWRTARSRVDASQVSGLDTQYRAYMADITDSPGKQAGAEVGESAAAAILELRSTDGFDTAVMYQCSTNPRLIGEFEPDGGCHTQPVGANAGQIKPFTFVGAWQFRPNGPIPLTSNAYIEDFEETRDYGRADSTVRTPEQTDIAYFWQSGDIHKAIRDLAINRGLSIMDSARFLAMVYTSAADANIAGFEAKYYFRHWRPRVAIPMADLDGNPDTAPDPTWKPLISVNHPEYPSAHSYNSTAQQEAIARFFGTYKVPMTITASRAVFPQLVQTERTYTDLNAVIREIHNARVWGGLHWRNSMRDGSQIGRNVAKHVCDNFFRRR